MVGWTYIIMHADAAVVRVLQAARAVNHISMRCQLIHNKLPIGYKFRSLATNFPDKDRSIAIETCRQLILSYWE